MKKRILSVLLSLLLIIPMLTFSPASAAEEKTVLWNEPAIPANVGETISLSSYGVQFTEKISSSASNVKWSYNGSSVKEFKPTEAGVFTLTAESGSNKKNIYVVAKNPSEKEYVLYYNTFDSADSISDWTMQKGMESRYSVSDSKLHMDATGQDMVRIILPAWLGEFGNYSITASVTSTEEKDTSRWNSIAYRMNGSTYPFYHMCVRKNCAGGSGVEYAFRNQSNAWEVLTTGSYTSNQVTGTYYKYNVQVRGDTALYSINDKPLVFNDDAMKRYVGNIALIANYSKMHIDYVKVTLQLTTPDFDTEPTLITPSATVENILNAFTNIAEITKKSDFDSLDNAHSAIVYVDAQKNIVDRAGNVIAPFSELFNLIGDDVIPIIYSNTTDNVRDINSMLLSNAEFPDDIGFMSADPKVLAYEHVRKSMARGVIDLRGKYDHILTKDDILEVRSQINGNGVKIGVLDASCLTQEVVSELRANLVTIWVYDECKDVASAVQAITLGGHGIISPNPDNVKAAYSFFAKDALTRTPIIIGHRGNPTNAPENSMSSYKAGYENGADVVETDVYISTDGEIVLMHDGTIDRTTDGTGNIESMSLEKIKSFHLWADNTSFQSKFPDERIPTLRELFEYLKDKEDLKVFVEIKTGKAEVSKKIIDLAKEYDVMDQISIISFSLQQCVNLQKAAPEISTGYLCSLQSGATMSVANESINILLKTVTPNNTTINPQDTSLNNKLAMVANYRGITIWPWTYTSSSGEKFCNSFLNGYGGLTTNDAQYTKNTVKSISVDLEDTVSLTAGTEMEFNATSTTYGRKENDISKKMKASIITGNDVVSVENGKLKALKAGEAKLMLSYSTALPIATKTYTLYSEVITVNVKSAENLENLTLTENSSFILKDGFIKNVLPQTTVDSVLRNFANADAKCDADPASIASTGTKIVNEINGKITDTAVIIIAGDINCDGKVDKSDVAPLGDIYTKKDSDTAKCMAADLNEDGNVNITDYVKMKFIAAGKISAK